MTRKLTELPSKRGPMSKIRPSDGCGRDAVFLVVNCGTISLNLGVIWEMSAAGGRAEVDFGLLDVSL